MVTCEWPTKEHPEWAPFLVQQVRALRKAGIEVDVYSFRGKKNPLRYLKAWANLQKRYKFKAVISNIAR